MLPSYKKYIFLICKNSVKIKNLREIFRSESKLFILKYVFISQVSVKFGISLFLNFLTNLVFHL